MSSESWRATFGRLRRSLNSNFTNASAMFVFLFLLVVRLPTVAVHHDAGPPLASLRGVSVVYSLTEVSSPVHSLPLFKELTTYGSHVTTLLVPPPETPRPHARRTTHTACPTLSPCAAASVLRPPHTAPSLPAPRIHTPRYSYVPRPPSTIYHPRLTSPLYPQCGLRCRLPLLCKSFSYFFTAALQC